VVGSVVGVSAAGGLVAGVSADGGLVVGVSAAGGLVVGGFESTLIFRASQAATKGDYN
jgi:hypothetical protein